MSGFFQQLAFATPLALWGLGLLPVIWWLLRATPPRPRQQAFPPIRILLGLPQQEETPDKTPWWLLLLRLTLAGLFCIAVAHPFLQPVSGKRLPPGERLVIIDNGWAAAKDWTKQQNLLLEVLRRAQEDGATVTLAATSPSPTPQDLQSNAAEIALDKARLMQPTSLPTDRTALLAQLKAATALTPASVLWLSDGFDGATAENFARDVQALYPKAALHILASPATTRPMALGAIDVKGADINVDVLRPAGAAATASLAVKAINGRTLTEYAVEFGNAESKRITINLPVALRNQIRSLAITGEDHAGARQLFDDRWRRKTVALMAGDTNSENQLLLSPLHYLRRGLEPFAELNEPQNATDLQNEIDAGLSMLALADVGEIPADIKANLTSWIEKGGILLRFAGPRLAASADDMLPVALRQGDRNLGSALSWDQPQVLSPFPDASPFAGLTIDPAIKVSRQVLADPTPDMAARTWASLADGTPLVTAEKRGKGLIVLFHVTANASWSNLPLSGLFLEMLQRIGSLDPTQGVAATDTAAEFAPRLVLNGYGDLVAPDTGTRAIAATAMDKAIVTAQTPPGLYVRQGQERALNLALISKDMLPMAASLAGIAVEAQEQAQKRDLAPVLFLLAALLLLLDTLVTLIIGGGLRPRKGLAATAAVLALLTGAPPPGVQAQTISQSDQDAALTTRLACIKTGDDDIDRTCMQGLASLTAFVTDRTSASLAEPVSLNVQSDELVFYPLLFWPVSETAQPLDDATRARISAYMKTGGTIFFDTRDGGLDLSPGGGGNPALKTLLDKLDLPPLEPAPDKHVLTRSFYLLSDFPGRYEGPRPWVESTANTDGEDPGTADGVSSIIIGANDYTAAWALDDSGQPLYATVPGSERQREFAFRAGVNLVMYALTGNYKADQVHVPALLERLGQ
jgi:hypothetical protein